MNNQDEELRSLIDQFSPLSGHTFFKSPSIKDYKGKMDIGIMGVPFDNGAHFRVGSRFAPKEIRTWSNYVTEYFPVYPWDYDIREKKNIVDLGDVNPFIGSGAIDRMLQWTEATAKKVYESGAKLLTIGGDHTIPYGPIRAASAKHGPISLIQLDSHTDTFDSQLHSSGMISHGSFAADLVREGNIDVTQSVQAYIRTFGAPPVEPNPYTVIYANDALAMGATALAKKIKEIVKDNPVYITLDIDALDPAYAPGTGTPVPGGPSSAELRQLLYQLQGIHLVGADLVEVSPAHDTSGITANVGAHLAADLLYLMA